MPCLCIIYLFVFHDDNDDDGYDGENDNNEQKDDQKKRHRPPAHPAVQVLRHLPTCLILSPSSYLTAHYFGTSALPAHHVLIFPTANNSTKIPHTFNPI